MVQDVQVCTPNLQWSTIYIHNYHYPPFFNDHSANFSFSDNPQVSSHDVPHCSLPPNISRYPHLSVETCDFATLPWVEGWKITFHENLVIFRVYCSCSFGMAYLTQWDAMGWKIKFMTWRTGPSLVVLLMYQVPFVPCISLYPQGIWRIQFNIGDACLFPPNVAYCANIEANLSMGRIIPSLYMLLLRSLL